MKPKTKRIITALILIFAVAAVIASAIISYDPPASDEGGLSVYYFDVGQGDAALAVWEDGAILIDAGTNESQYRLVSEIKRLGVRTIDCAVFSHPHDDHIGGADEVLANFNVKSVIMPDVSSEYRTYEKMCECIADEECFVYEAVSGRVFEFGDVKLEVLGPLRYSDDLNLDSAVVMLTFGETKFLFTGDMEGDAERELIDAAGDEAIDCDVVKVGHHGSQAATTDEFLEKTTPLIAVISCGKLNEYGHPHASVLSRLKSHGIETYRTDISGTVTIESDGHRVVYRENKKGVSEWIRG